eukprot:3939383-Rhodomonas_salina.2
MRGAAGEWSAMVDIIVDAQLSIRACIFVESVSPHMCMDVARECGTAGAGRVTTLTWKRERQSV